jgi:hypothetical protein
LGEYRFAPDLGYYLPCQKAIAQHLDELAEAEKDGPPKMGAGKSVLWNSTNPNCPLLALPGTIRVANGIVYFNFNHLIPLKELNACQLQEGQWYELVFRSAIQFEMLLPNQNIYQQLWANQSTTFVFKPEREVWRNGTELYWLQRLLQLRVKLFDFRLINSNIWQQNEKL